MVCVWAKALQSCLTLCNLWTIGHQAPLSMGFSRQEYWSGLPCPPPGHLPDPGMEPVSAVTPALQAGYLLLSPQGIPGLGGRGSPGALCLRKWHLSSRLSDVKERGRYTPHTVEVVKSFCKINSSYCIFDFT